MANSPASAASNEPTQVAGQARLRLFDSEAFRAMADLLPCPVSVYDHERRIRFVNARLIQLSGYALDQILGWRDEDLWPAEVTRAFVPHLCRVYETGTAQSAEYTFAFGEASFHLSANYLPSFDEHGKVAEVISVVADPNNQESVDSELRRQRRHIQTLTENVPDVICRFDRQGRHLFVNRHMGTSAGMPPAAFLTCASRELGMPKELVALWETKLARVWETGQPLEFEFSYPGPSGVQYYESRLIPELGSAGSVETILVVSRDVTSRRQVEIELEKSREQLKYLVQTRTRELEASQRSLRVAEHLASIGTLAAGISHEVNNPLGAIVMAAETALAGLADDPSRSVSAHLEMIRTDALRCGRIVQNVLSFVREESTAKTRGCMCEVVQQALERLRPYAQSLEKAITVDLHPAPMIVRMNPTAVEQAIGNVVRNAIESNPQTPVRVSTTRCDDHCSVIVEDDGRGMPAEIHSKLFEPFFTTRRADGGVGLGMSLVRAIINDHQGQIVVDTQVGRGTRVTIHLPCAAEAAS